MRIRTQGHTGTHLEERGEIPILIGLQDRHHMTPLLMQVGEKFGGHALSIHDHSCDVAVSGVLLITCQQRRNSCSEMLVSPMGGDEKGMALLIVQ